MVCDGLNSWANYFLALGFKPLNCLEMDELLFNSILSAVEAGYIPSWKLREQTSRGNGRGSTKGRGKGNDDAGGKYSKLEDMYD